MIAIGATRYSRRAALGLLAALTGFRRKPVQAEDQQRAPEIVVSAAPPDAEEIEFDRKAFGIVGVFDIDWLTQPGFEQLLDNLAASPGAFHGVRFFGAFTAGTPELLAPDGGGSIWPRVDDPIDFSITLNALSALTTRGLTPFIALGFFPPAVSASPIQPPESWDAWKMLVRSFLEVLVADERFGPAAISDWWFEVWNEPNEGRFWQGTPDDYLELYRATSEAVADLGLSIRLGGPAIAYKPQVDPESGAPWIERFLQFIAADSTLQCDFISLHRKGTVGDDPPDPRRLHSAASATADQMLAIDPVRFQGMTIINDEADEKVGFEVPYAPRMDERNPAWLVAAMIIQTTLNRDYAAADLRFSSAADNANLQLVQAPFDGRRSIMTRATTGTERDLLKIPAYGFYELLRLQGEVQLPVISGAEHCFPQADLYYLSTLDDGCVTTLISYYPDPSHVNPEARTHTMVVTDIPGRAAISPGFKLTGHIRTPMPPRVALAPIHFRRPIPRCYRQFDWRKSLRSPGPSPGTSRFQAGAFPKPIEIEPYTTICLWITPVQDTRPEAPVWLELKIENGNVILRWSPNREPFFYSYEVCLMRDGARTELLTPDPLRAALWIDTGPSPGRRVYGVRAVSASGLASDLVNSPEVVIEEG